MTALARARDQAVVLQAASVCLRYPDAALLELMPVVRDAVDALPASRPGNGSARSSTRSRPPRPSGRRSTTSRCSTPDAAAAST